MMERPPLQWLAGRLEAGDEALASVWRRPPGAPPTLRHAAEAAVALWVAMALFGVVIGYAVEGHSERVAAPAILPLWWLLVVVAVARDRGVADEERPSYRAMAVGGAVCAFTAPLCVLAAYASTVDAGYEALVAGLLCGSIPTLPLPMAVAWRLFGRRRPGLSRALPAVAAASLVALGALSLAAAARRARAPAVFDPFVGLSATTEWPSPFANAARSEGWERVSPADARDVRYRRRLGAAAVSVEGDDQAFQCFFLLGDAWPRDGDEQGPGWYAPCSESVRLRYDAHRGSLVAPDLPGRSRPWMARDLRARRPLRSVADVSAARPLAAPLPWIAAGVLGLVAGLLAWRRARALPLAVDPRRWREGKVLPDRDTVVFTDGSRPLQGAAHPVGCKTPVVVPVESAAGATAYREAPRLDPSRIFRGTMAEADGTLQDARDAGFADVIAVAWVAGAPLLAAWWRGLL